MLCLSEDLLRRSAFIRSCRTITLLVVATTFMFISHVALGQAPSPKTKQSAATRATGPNAVALDVAINKSERQSMHAERAVKLYAQIALNVSPGRAGMQLMESVMQFDSELAWLKANSPTPTLLPMLEAQARAWASLKATLTQSPVRENIPQIADLSNALLIKTQATVQAIAALTENPLDELVGQSARQRVLIQRLGKFYMLDRAGYAGAKRKFNETKAEFLAAHTALSEAKGINEPIKRELQLIMGQAKMLFVNFVDGRIGGDDNDALVGKSTEVMMQMQDVVTTMLERL